MLNLSKQMNYLFKHMQHLSKQMKHGLRLSPAFLALMIASLLLLSGCNTNGKKKDAYKGMSAEHIYELGQKNMAKEKYGDAIKDFEALESRYPYNENSSDAQLALVTAYYKRSEYALALSCVDRFIRMNPGHPQVDYAHYLKGMISFDQNTTLMYRHLPIDRSLRDSTPAHESFAAFKEMLELYPNSKYAPEARQRMVALRDQLANHELNAVQYYLKRGAYLSAANRANYILQNYSQTQAVPEALCSMIISYRKLGMDQLSNDAENVLRTNFPNQPVPK